MSTAHYWTPQEDEILHQHYATSSNAEIEAMFPGRNLHGIKIRACRLGLRKELVFHEMGMPFTGSVIGHLSDTDKAYLAGIIDGEGCITIHRRTPKAKENPTYALFVEIANTSPALKKWLDERFPDRTYYRHITSAKPHHKQGYGWVLSGNRQVMIFLREIAPYLVIKREQAELVAQGYVHLPEEERYALYKKLQELKKYA
jgi:hypothetical protein